NTRNQQWTYPFLGYSRRIQFTRDLDQGLYNATLVQLDRPDLLLEYSRPGRKLGSSTPLETADLRPPIWISAVAIDGLLPIPQIATYDDPVEPLTGKGFVYQRPPETINATVRGLYASQQQGTLTVIVLVLGIVGVLLGVVYMLSVAGVVTCGPEVQPRFP